MSFALDFLADCRDILMFRDQYGSVDAFDIAIGVMFWLLILFLIVIASRTIYRLIAYDYEVVIFSATVTGKEFEPECHTIRMCGKYPMPVTYDAEYNVYFVTKNGLDDVIDDRELYDWAKKGSKFRVTMKIGRDRSPHRKIKYWRTLQYSWD